MSAVEITEIIGSLLGSLLAFATLMYLLLLLRTLHQRGKRSTVLGCLTICVAFIFIRQLAVVLLAVDTFSESTQDARAMARYGLTILGVGISALVALRMARWQFDAQQAQIDEEAKG